MEPTIFSLLLEISGENLSQFKRTALTSLKVHLHNVAANVLQQSLDKLSADEISWNLESQGVNALVQNVKSFCVGSGSVIGKNVLTNIPGVVVLFVTADKRELARQSVGCFHCQ